MPGTEYTFQNLVIVVMSGPSQGERISLERPLLLGRDTRSRIPFDDERVSRHHALIDLIDSKPVLRDLGSKNGTFVNGAEIKDFHFLRPGDRIRLGKTLMSVVSIAADHRGGIQSLANATHIDTRAEEDSESRNSDSPIGRRLLRQATELVSRLAPYAKTRYPLYPIVGVIRKEFRADGAGIFFGGAKVEPVYTEGDLLLSDATLDEIRTGILAGTLATATLINHREEPHSPSGSVIVFPLRSSEDTTHLFILRREESRPFEEEQRGFAEALSECLRMLPLRDILNRKSSRQGADSLSQIIGSSEALNKVRDLIATYAAANATVLITGESGTGKELSARALHQLSDRRFSPYVEMNSACMMPELVESELFGHEKGAFTGALDRTLGKLEIASGGTLFLDEIGELPLDLQAKLLRVLEGQPFYRVGGRELITVDVRFICATNRDLESMVENGTFRRDLYHRINILGLELPPLRQHPEDIPEIVQFLMSQIEEEVGSGQTFSLNPKVYRRLLSHAWPGNVRELRNVLQRMMLLATGRELDERSVPPEIGRPVGDSTTMKLPRLQVLTEMLEREEISRILAETNGQKSRAAKMLGISRPTLDKKIKYYGLGNMVPRRDDEDGDEQPVTGTQDDE